MISIIIPTYNRFPYLLNSIKSVKEQTYKNIEIIVVNDNSDDIRYKKYLKSTDKMKVIHLDINTKKKFGYPCPGHVRNIGLQNINIKTKYVAFLDDDDYWLPSKLQEQINFMEKTKM